MEFLTVEFLGRQQKFIINCRAEGMTYSQTKLAWEEEYPDLGTLTSNLIATALKRAALGLYWEKGNHGGADPYLCERDQLTLKEIIEDSAYKGEALEAADIIDEAFKLKELRRDYGYRFLLEINCPTLAEEVINTLGGDDVSRPYVNHILQQLHCKLKACQEIEESRYMACEPRIIEEFYDKHRETIESTPEELIFSIDETFINKFKKKKVALPEEIEHMIAKGIPNFPHITALCGCSMTGKSVPPLFVLPCIAELPRELKVFQRERHCWFTSTPKGWVNRSVFLLYCIFFIEWLNFERQRMPEDIRDKPALIVCDGHSSSENPLALFLLASANIKLIVLPAHTTHILQVFDVGIAKRLKSKFTDYLRDYIKAPKQEFNSNAAMMRYAIIYSFISAWQESVSLRTVQNAAAACGLCPCSVEALKHNKYVRELTPAEKELQEKRNYRNRNRFNINGEELTTMDMICAISDNIKKNPANHRFCRKPEQDTKERFYFWITNYLDPSTELLTKPPNMPGYSPND